MPAPYGCLERRGGLLRSCRCRQVHPGDGVRPARGEQWADDTLVMQVGSGRVHAIPIAYDVALRPPSIAHFGDRAGSVRVIRASGGPVPLRALFLIERTSPSPAIQPLAPTVALQALLPHACAFSMTDAVRRRLMVEQYLALVDLVPVYRLSYPSTFECLPDVADLVRSTVAGQEPAAVSMNTSVPGARAGLPRAWPGWVAALRVLVRVLPLPRVVRLAEPRSVTSSPHERDVRRIVALAQTVTSRATERPETMCLVRSLVTYRYLARAGSTPSSMWVSSGSRGAARPRLGRGERRAGHRSPRRDRVADCRRWRSCRWRDSASRHPGPGRATRAARPRQR